MMDACLVDICYTFEFTFKPVHVASPNLSSYTLSSNHVGGSKGKMSLVK